MWIFPCILLLSGPEPSVVRIPLTLPLLIQIPPGARPLLKGDTLLLLNLPSEDSVQITPLTLPAPPSTSSNPTSPIEPTNSINPINPSPLPEPPNFNVRGTRLFSAAYGEGGVRLEGGLDLRIQGTLPGNSRVEGVIRDQGGTATAQTLELAQLDEAFLRFSSKGGQLTLGNFRLSLPGFRRSLQGVAIEGKNHRGLYRAFYGLQRGVYRRVTLQARSGFNGPYFLMVPPRPRPLTILRGSEQIFLNGVLMKRGEDYELDYETGALTFTPKRVLSEGDQITALFQEVRGPVPRYVGGLEWKARLGPTQIGGIFLSEGYRKADLTAVGVAASGEKGFSFDRTRLWGFTLQGAIRLLTYRARVAFSDRLPHVLQDLPPEKGQEFDLSMGWRLGPFQVKGGLLWRSPTFHPLLDLESPGDAWNWRQSGTRPPRLRQTLSAVWRPLPTLTLQAEWARRDSLRRTQLTLSGPIGSGTYTLKWVQSTLFTHQALDLAFSNGQIRLYREWASLQRTLGAEGQAKWGAIRSGGRWKSWWTQEGSFSEALLWVERPVPGGMIKLGAFALATPNFHLFPLISGQGQRSFGDLSGEIHFQWGAPVGGGKEEFLWVGPGRGTYRKDRQTGTMVPDPLGDYIRILAPSPDLDPTAHQRLHLHLQYMGHLLLVWGDLDHQKQGDLLRENHRIRVEARPTGLWGPYGEALWRKEGGIAPFRERKAGIGIRVKGLRAGIARRAQDGLWGSVRESRLYVRHSFLELFAETRHLDGRKSQGIGIELRPNVHVLSARLSAFLRVFYRRYPQNPPRHFLFPEDAPGLGYRYTFRLSRPFGRFLLTWSASGDGGEKRRSRNTGSLGLQLNF